METTNQTPAETACYSAISSFHSSALYLSCFSGISGNMFIGALLDAGLSEQALRDMAGTLPLTGYRLNVSRVNKGGVAATHFEVELDPAEKQPHRNLADIVHIIKTAGLSEKVKVRSIAVFKKLAEAEAKIHGTTVDKIHFHEIGAVDAIIDVVGTVSGLETLGIEKLYAGNLRTGSGFVACAHGKLPVPAPATAELLQGIPYTHGDIAKELITPTGAALLATLCDGFGDRPEGFITEATAYGAGDWDLEIPNVLRAEIGQIVGRASCSQEPVLRRAGDTPSRIREGHPTTHELIVLETNIDDSDPRIFNYVMERLFKAGVLDVWLTPIQMKKNRPAVKLSVLAPAALQGAVETIIFTETTTLGIRSWLAQRTALERREETVETPWGGVRVKISSMNGAVCSITPEYDDCRRLAEAAGVPLYEVIRLARDAASG